MERIPLGLSGALVWSPEHYMYKKVKTKADSRLTQQERKMHYVPTHMYSPNRTPLGGANHFTIIWYHFHLKNSRITTNFILNFTIIHCS